MWKINSENKLAQEGLDKFNRRLFKTCAQLGFDCTQVNGQRICASMEFCEKPFPKGTEIFIGKIPRNIFEDELLPLFMKAGKLYQFRLMLDFSLKNRGFAFATYATIEGAEKAIALFNEYEIRPKFKMGVFKSVDNCRLFFGNIPQNFNKADILKVLHENSIEGVTDIILYKDLVKPRLNRGYVFVEFSSHRDAAMARKQLYPGCLIVEGQAVFVDWADPIPDVDPRVMAKVTKLFIHHLPVDLTKDDLSRFIGKLVDASTVIKVHKQMDYAFVHFEDRQSAEVAKAALRDLPFPEVVVEWARPKEYSKQLRLESPPTHFCLSLPPKMRRHYQQYLTTFISDTSSNESQKLSPTSAKSVPNEMPSWISKTEMNDPPAKNSINSEMANNNLPARSIINTQMLNAMSTYLQPHQSLPPFPRDDESGQKLENFKVTQPAFPPIFQQYHRVARPPTPLAPSPPLAASTPLSNLCREELYRNPLIGLPISLMPTRSDFQRRATPPPIMMQERSNFNEMLYPNSCRNTFSRPAFYKNASLFSSAESSPMVQNPLMAPNYKPLFEFF